MGAITRTSHLPQGINLTNPEHQGQPNIDLDLAIKILLLIKAIEVCKKTENQFLSSYFLRKKPDGTYRFILNLKNLNFFIKPEHFKIENVRTALNLLDKEDYMCRLNLKDAYLLVSINSNDKKFLRFKYKGKIFQLNALPFGLSSAPFVFTKIMKLVVNKLRKQGIKLVVYLDDFLIKSDSKQKCQKNTNEVMKLLLFLGFIINDEKSDLMPKKTCKFLGIDSKYNSHSTRHASSKSFHNEIDVNIIKKAVRWSEKAKTVAKFYKRPIEAQNFAKSVFSCVL